MELQRDISLAGACSRLKRHNLGIRHGFSVGAGSGVDTKYIHNSLAPDSEILLVEAQDVHRDALTRLHATTPRLPFSICAAGREDGVARFENTSPIGGAVVQAGDNTIEVPMRSIDSLSGERKWTGPFFIKLDTHGVEEDILIGATETLRRTHLLMIEAYNFRLNHVGGRNMLFYELCLFLAERGFRFVDLCEPLFRPNSLAFWQMHMFFIRADNPVFNSNSYKG